VKFEPIVIVKLIGAALSLVVAFGLPVTDDQREAILTFAGIVAVIMAGEAFAARSFVWSKASVEKIAPPPVPNEAILP